jgi:PPM family protein phosphatase
MQAVNDASFDVASAISKGQRPYQEDALVTDFALGTGLGFVVLADGMGGHAAGDVASKIVVTEVFSELKLQSGDPEAFRQNLPEILREAALAANECVRGHIEANAETAGMGATLLAPVLVGTSLYWISIGDSPLLLFRDGALRQINEDHSMAPQIDFMIKTGILSEDVGRNHPDRSCLISVLGGEEIPRIDCPAEPLDLRDGDVLIAASDGLQYLTMTEIEDVLITHRDKPSAWLANALLARLDAFGDPEQDNASFAIMKVAFADAATKGLPPAPTDRIAHNAPPANFAARPPSRLGSALLLRGASLFRSIAQ